MTYKALTPLLKPRALHSLMALGMITSTIFICTQVGIATLGYAQQTSQEERVPTKPEEDRSLDVEGVWIPEGGKVGQSSITWLGVETPRRTRAYDPGGDPSEPMPLSSTGMRVRGSALQGHLTLRFWQILSERWARSSKRRSMVKAMKSGSQKTRSTLSSTLMSAKNHQRSTVHIRSAE